MLLTLFIFLTGDSPSEWRNKLLFFLPIPRWLLGWEWIIVKENDVLVPPEETTAVKVGCCCLVAQSCPTLCDRMDWNPPGSFVHGISQARILEWIAIFFSRGSCQPRDQTSVSCIAGGFFTDWATRKTPDAIWDSSQKPACHIPYNDPRALTCLKLEVLVPQSCPALCDFMDCSSPGFSVHGILQARILAWVVVPPPGNPPDPGIKPRTPTLQVDFLPSEPPGKPLQMAHHWNPQIS